MAKIELISSTNYILNGSREYAIYVAQQRAIPHVADGLKVGQRIALWLLRNKTEKTKTVGLGGQMASEKLYVHGDVAANNARSGKFWFTHEACRGYWCSAIY